MRPRSMAVAAALLTLALAGCGGASGPSLSAFKSGFAADKAQFRQLGTDISATISSARTKSNSQLATEFGSLSARATRQAAQLRKLNPPSQYKGLLDRLSAGFDSVAGSLRAIESAATANNGSAARAASVALTQAAGRVKGADRALTGKLGLPQTG